MQVHFLDSMVLSYFKSIYTLDNVKCVLSSHADLDVIHLKADAERREDENKENAICYICKNTNYIDIGKALPASNVSSNECFDAANKEVNSIALNCPPKPKDKRDRMWCCPSCHTTTHLYCSASTTDGCVYSSVIDREEEGTVKDISNKPLLIPNTGRCTKCFHESSWVDIVVSMELHPRDLKKKETSKKAKKTNNTNSTVDEEREEEEDDNEEDAVVLTQSRSAHQKPSWTSNLLTIESDMEDEGLEEDDQNIMYIGDTSEVL